MTNPRDAEREAEARARQRAHELMNADRHDDGSCNHASDWTQEACDRLTAELLRLETEAEALSRERDEASAAFAYEKRINEDLATARHRLIDERDRFEGHIGDIVASVGLECEWTNLHAHENCVGEAFAVVEAERDAALRSNAELQVLLGEAMEFAEEALNGADDCSAWHGTSWGDECRTRWRAFNLREDVQRACATGGTK